MASELSPKGRPWTEWTAEYIPATGGDREHVVLVPQAAGHALAAGEVPLDLQDWSVYVGGNIFHDPLRCYPTDVQFLALRSFVRSGLGRKDGGR